MNLHVDGDDYTFAHQKHQAPRESVVLEFVDLFTKKTSALLLYKAPESPHVGVHWQGLSVTVHEDTIRDRLEILTTALAEMLSK